MANRPKEISNILSADIAIVLPNTHPYAITDNTDNTPHPKDRKPNIV
ncbi:MAG: hypothetical protein NC091_01495 [Bacteroides sp.]|nr:hypothetical protein [Bacteroides sp.]